MRKRILNQFNIGIKQRRLSSKSLLHHQCSTKGKKLLDSRWQLTQSCVYHHQFQILLYKSPHASTHGCGVVVYGLFLLGKNLPNSYASSYRQQCWFWKIFWILKIFHMCQMFTVSPPIKIFHKCETQKRVRKFSSTIIDKDFKMVLFETVKTFHICGVMRGPKIGPVVLTRRGGAA